MYEKSHDEYMTAHSKTQSMYKIRQQMYETNKGNNKIPNSEQSYKGKVKTHIYINRQNQSATGKL